jgi:hypothetical protein
MNVHQKRAQKIQHKWLKATRTGKKKNYNPRCCKCAAKKMIVHKVFELNFKSPPSINLNLISLTPQSKTSYYQTVDI